MFCNNYNYKKYAKWYDEDYDFDEFIDPRNTWGWAETIESGQYNNSDDSFSDEESDDTDEESDDTDEESDDTDEGDGESVLVSTSLGLALAHIILNPTN